MIKAIVCDIGRVLCVEGGDLDFMEDRFGFDRNKFKEEGKKALKESFKKNSYHFEKSISDLHDLDFEVFLPSLQKYRRECFEFNEGVKKIILELKRNYLLVSFTNVTFGYEEIRREIGIYDLFDFNLTSLNEKLTKPDKEFYEKLISFLGEKGISPDESIFIDDLEKNLVPARERGMKTILFENASQLKRDLIKFGVKLNGN